MGHELRPGRGRMNGDAHDSREERLLLEAARSGRITRRQLIQRATVLGLSVPTIGALLAACGGDDEEGAAPAPAEPAPAEPAPAEPAPSGEPFKVGFVYIG